MRAIIAFLCSLLLVIPLASCTNDTPAAASYTVCFVLEDGSTSTYLVGAGECAVAPQFPEPPQGWYENPNLLSPSYDFSMPVNRDITLYGKWVADAPASSWTVHFLGTDGVSGPTLMEVKHGDRVARPADPVRNGHVFLGWYLDDLYTRAYDFNAPVTQNLYLYPLWASASQGREDFFTVRENGDGTVAVTGLTYLAEGVDVIEVPQTIGGMRVSSIESNGLGDDIRCIILPEGLETIGDYAFQQMDHLVSVVIPDSVKEIGDFAFYFGSEIFSV